MSGQRAFKSPFQTHEPVALHPVGHGAKHGRRLSPTGDADPSIGQTAHSGAHHGLGDIPAGVGPRLPEQL
ncbi:hypothetical protein D3C80_1736780 [compost metagenome]